MSTENSSVEQIKLFRRIAREVAYEVLDEHIEDYEHKAKKPDTTELEEN
jgi:hypothetical protein